jgi:hypothetical protein
MTQPRYTMGVSPEIIKFGSYKNYNYYICDFGTHPTAYVEIPRRNKLYKKDYDEIYVKVHGGITYSENILPLLIKGGWFIGWDYCHYGDYNAFMPFKEGKKWTTEEIIKECKNVINQVRTQEKWYAKWLKLKR